jgi:nucleotide-binding universal stress UspA family protein
VENMAGIDKEVAMYQKILLPLDGSKLAECIIPYAEELGKLKPSIEIVLLQVCDPPVILADYPEGAMPHGWEEHVEEQKTLMQKQCAVYIEDMAKKLRDQGFKVVAHSRLGNPAEQIMDHASENNVDMILMASHGRSGISRWAYGSVADKVLRSSCIPVLMVKAPGCVPGV